MILLRLLISVLMLGSLLSCGASYEEPDSAIEAGRQFISAIYNGNFKRAGQLISDEKENRQILTENIEKDFRLRSGFAKDSLSKMSIQINQINTIDSVSTSISFTNAYNNSESVLLVKKEDGLWRVTIEKIK
ncbi:MAG: hypothetical protein MUE99_00090 [Chitinophagaceae bacterium]|nr:hypothetical protein [Chitinophagaceae bacterium]